MYGVDVQLRVSKLYTANYSATKPIVINQGGSSSSKTYSLLQVLIQKLSEQPNKVATVAGRDIPNLKVGAIRDFKNIWRTTPHFNEVIKKFNGSDNFAEFYNGSILEFKSFGDEHDARGSRRDYLFVNEANGISWAIVDQLMARTRIRTYIDYNPSSRFWAHDEIMAKMPKEDWTFIKSTYKNNPFLTDKIVSYIEGKRDTDPYWWQVYGLGEIGRLEGAVYTNWGKVDAIPDDAEFIAYGLDFGFSVDPAAVVAVYRFDGELYVNELVYDKGLTNADLADILKEQGVKGYELIYADSAEPKSIEEIKRKGFSIKPTKKGADSIRGGIEILKKYRINVVRTAVNVCTELENYTWKKDRMGKQQAKPIDDLNHALDALRYVALSRLTGKRGVELIGVVG